MSERLQVARDWLPRYTGMPLDHFGDYILLTNFRYHLDAFTHIFGPSGISVGRKEPG